MSRPALLSTLGGQRAWAVPTISRDQGLPRGHARIERISLAERSTGNELPLNGPIGLCCVFSSSSSYLYSGEQRAADCSGCDHATCSSGPTQPLFVKRMTYGDVSLRREAEHQHWR